MKKPSIKPYYAIIHVFSFISVIRGIGEEEESADDPIPMETAQPEPEAEMNHLGDPGHSAAQGNAGAVGLPTMSVDAEFVLPNPEGGCTGCCSVCSAPCSSQAFMIKAYGILRRLEEGFYNTESLRNEARQAIAKIDKNLVPSSGTTADPPSFRNLPGSDVILRSGRSIEALQMASNGCLQWNSEGTALMCTICANGRKNSGLFRYERANGCSFGTKEVLPPRFKSLRDAVNKHLKSPAHVNAARAADAEDEKSKSQDEAANCASTRVLRTSYFLLKKSLSQMLFEDAIVLQHMNGAKMGDLNHSRHMMVISRAAFSAELLKRVKHHVESQPCVSVLADKVTVARRTVDIIAILTLVPTAEPNTIFQSVVVGAPVVKKHDGDSLASGIRGALAQVGVTNANQLAAICADGQYHHNAVPQKLVRQLGDSAAVVPAVWDPAHLLNLADADARNDQQSPWIQETINEITTISRRFSTGKGWEDLQKCGEHLGVPALRPKLWSDTRFAAHAADVLTVFRRNYSALKMALERRLEEESRAGHVHDIRRELASLRGEE